MKLSIIIPYWNAEPYTSELLDVLAPQMNSEVECVVVDDGSKEPFKTDYKWCRVLRKENGGCSTARNMGIDNTTGDYLSFLDADDLVPDYFVEKLIKKIDESRADVIDFSWKSLNLQGSQHDNVLKSDDDYLTNPSVCTRAFKRAFIGDNRFNEKKDSTEDEDFSRKCGYLDHEGYKHAAITDYMYFYRTAVTNSKVKRFKYGLMKTKRVTFYYNHITEDMTWLLEEIKKEDEVNEVFVLTNQNDIPEIRRYARVIKPCSLWTHYLYGEPNNLNISIVPIAEKTDIAIYCSKLDEVSGITTSIYNFIRTMAGYYKILLVYDEMADSLHDKFGIEVKLMKNDKAKISCDTLIMEKLKDKIPKNIIYKKSIQICHACKLEGYHIPKDRDILVNVSQTSKDSWGEESKNGVVIHNFSVVEKEDLLLVSATRTKASDKGDNDARMRTLAEKMNKAGIKYTWLNFSDKGLDNPPENFINMNPVDNIQNFIKRADYLVQLSDREACPMVIIEALSLNVPILACPFESLYELGFEDDEMGYVVPFDMNFDVRKILWIPKYDFRYGNKKLFQKWKKVLEQKIEPSDTKVEVLRGYKDLMLDEYLHEGEIVFMKKSRAEELLKNPNNLIRIL